MHPDTAFEKESLVVVLDRGILCYLDLEQEVQSLFKISEPMLFYYQDSDNQTIMVVHDNDLLNWQEEIEKKGIPRVIFAMTQRAYLASVSSPILVKSVIKRYLSNFSQNSDARTSHSFHIALLHAESVLNGLNCPTEEVREFRIQALNRYESNESVSNSDTDNSDEFQDNNDDLKFQPDETFQMDEFTGDLEVNKTEMVCFQDEQLLDDFDIESKILSSLSSDAKEFDHFTKVSSTNDIQKRRSESSNNQVVMSGQDLKNESLLTCKNDSQIFNISDSFSLSYDGAFLKTKKTDTNTSYQMDKHNQKYK